MGEDYCEVGRSWVAEYEGEVCEGFDYGIRGILTQWVYSCCFKVPGAAMGVQVFHVYIITEVENKVKVCREIGRTDGYR